MKAIALTFRFMILPIIWAVDLYESIRDNIGTRSVLFGVHQVFIHPIFVAIAWNKLYGWKPEWYKKQSCCDKHIKENKRFFFGYWLKLAFCFIVHDWGYFGKSEMDGIEGDKHPVLGAELAQKFLDKEISVDNPVVYGTSFLVKSNKWYHFCLTHSRYYAKQLGLQPSKLCMADKLAVYYYPNWLYLSLAWLTGELKEYMLSAESAGKHGHMKLDTATPTQWLNTTKKYLYDYAFEHRYGKPDTKTELTYLGVSSKTTIGGKDLGTCKVYIGEPIDNSDLNALLKDAIEATKRS